METPKNDQKSSGSSYAMDADEDANPVHSANLPPQFKTQQSTIEQSPARHPPPTRAETGTEDQRSADRGTRLDSRQESGHPPPHPLGDQGRNSRVRDEKTAFAAVPEHYLEGEDSDPKPQGRSAYTRLVGKTGRATIRTEAEIVRQSATRLLREIQMLSRSKESVRQKKQGNVPKCFDDLNDRMARHLLQVEENRKQRRAEAEYMQMKECRFSPAINGPSADSCTSLRTVDCFYADQISYVNNTAKKLKETKKNLQLDALQELTLSPKICKRSENLFATMTSTQSETTTVFDRLHAHSRDRKRRFAVLTSPGNKYSSSAIQLVESPYRCKSPTPGSPEPKFAPQILERSKKMHREQTVGENLYSEAMQRLDSRAQEVQARSRQLTESVQPSYVLKESKEQLEGRFAGLFRPVWEAANPIKDPEAMCTVDCVNP